LVERRAQALAAAFPDPDAARRHAAAVKDHVLANLGALLQQFEGRARANGIEVVWARDADEAVRAVLGCCPPRPARIVKGKSMATEEIGLNAALEAAGHQVVETDLGEYVAQLDGDHPSHIVAPIIHKDRADAARAFRQAGVALGSDDPGEIASAARSRLREEFRNADVGVSGANFCIAETGRIVIVENEGNNRLSTTAPAVHVVVAGIERLLPREADLALFLPLLAGSATGQAATVYTHFVTGPRAEDEPDGPERVVLVLLDNGRSRVRAGPQRAVLRCLRCGACLNVCPVYRQVSGHAYRNVYSGPLGAVLAPSMAEDGRYSDLPFASTLCGACRDVCPVDIPIPDMLLRLRASSPRRQRARWALWQAVASWPAAWRALIRLALAHGREWRAGHARPDPHDGADDA
jgi:L-lactate dehydrogenase complex protein LldF